MNEKAYILNEFLKTAGITKDDIELWEKLKLFKPIGFTEDKVPFYANETLEEVGNIKKLIELGYRPEEIQKIIKKIGLPQKNGKPAKIKKPQYLTVGTLAEKVNVSPRTIKHWEDKGILEPDMRSEGGFRMYSEQYVFFGQLIKDLQLFGYSLDEIKTISDYFRDFITIQTNIEIHGKEETEQKLETMNGEIQSLLEKTNLLKEGIQRWEALLRKKKKELAGLKTLNQKRNHDDKEGNINAKDDIH
ncbi:MerR family transcriptional regulator [candidate division KSB1 bacterium]|nr:MerR family transcriptional regulator [candidate division KSB1 bacterium]